MKVKWTICVITILLNSLGLFSQTPNLEKIIRFYSLNLNITDNMGYEELYQAIDKFIVRCSDDEKCQCPAYELLKKDREAVKTWKTERLQKLTEDKNMSYKEKKQILQREYADVIKYIRKMSTIPLEELVEINSKEKRFCEWHTLACAQRGDASCQFKMGDYYRRTHRADITYAVFLLGSAAAQGYSRAHFVLGEIFIKSGNLETATQEYLKGANLGDIDCLFALGKIAEEALHNDEMALFWFSKAAAKEHRDAIIRCAYICNRQKKYHEAIDYYKQAISFEEKTKNYGFRARIAGYKDIIQKIELKIED